jgi:hypothetical protein
LEYGVLLAVLGRLWSCPLRLPAAILAYGIVMHLRLLTVWVTPLDPPADCIVLVDPVVALVGGGKEPTRDLFFSGHTAALFVFALSAPQKRWRLCLYLMGTLVAVLLLIQRAHYTVDVVVAPFMAIAAWMLAASIVGRSWRRYRQRREPRAGPHGRQHPTK